MAQMKKYSGMLVGKAPPDVHCTPEPSIQPTVFWDGQGGIPKFEVGTQLTLTNAQELSNVGAVCDGCWRSILCHVC